jgi:hypothetical protein
MFETAFNLKHYWMGGVNQSLRGSLTKHHQALRILDPAFVIYDEHE